MSKILLDVISHSLGDNVSVAPLASKYAEQHSDDEIYVTMSDPLVDYFNNTYTNVNFIRRDHGMSFDEVIPLYYKFDKSVQGGFAEQLGFSKDEYIRPKLEFTPGPRPIKNKYVAIGIHSTVQLKYWNHPGGKRVQPESPNWNDICRMIRKAGYTPVLVEQHESFGLPPFFNGAPKKAQKKCGQSLSESMNLVYHAEFYIGISSGMSWIAHAMGKKVAMIANFTEDWNEFDLNLDDYIRITNKSVCHGCWNKIGIEHDFNNMDWYWCPRHRDTEREFECHTSITPEQVYEQISPWLV